jgi:hypothetical protein
MKESDYKSLIVKSIRKEGGYARRIEDQFSVGMPDMVLMPLRCPVIWAEIKVVSGYTFGPTPRQLIELQRLYRSPYSIPCVIGVKKGRYFIGPPKAHMNLQECDEMDENETISDLIRRFVAHV